MFVLNRDREYNLSMSSVSTDYVKYEPSYKVLKALLYPVALSFRPKIYGKENIPEEGPVIICLNHRYNPDPAWACLATRRVVHFLAKRNCMKASSACSSAWLVQFQLTVRRMTIRPWMLLRRC